MTKTISCPLCRGEIHAIAGRCKHCKADLVDLRERAARVARAQAIGATVPPSPRPFHTTSPMPAQRASTIPPGRPSTVPPEEAGEGVPPAPDSARTLVDSPGEAFAHEYQGFAHEYHGNEHAPHYQPPPLHAPHHSPPNGTPAYGLGFAGGRPHRVSSWSRRWSLVVSAVALLAIGISIGVLAERWRDSQRRAQTKPRTSQVSRRPAMVPDHMPQPLMPGPQRLAPDRTAPPQPPTPDRQSAPPAPTEPDPDPAQPSDPDPAADPDPSNPGSRFSQPSSPSSGGDARAFRTFTSALTDSLCQKLSQCGVIDSATQSMCHVFASELDSEDAADKVARGECSFNQKAADACLRAVADLSCDVGSSDRMWEWLRTPSRVGECADAYVCQ